MRYSKPIDNLGICTYCISKSTGYTCISEEGHLWWKHEFSYTYPGITLFHCSKVQSSYPADYPCTIADQVRCPVAKED